MEKFLAASKAKLADLRMAGKVTVVMGNQTCDLDSAVCALVEGLLRYQEARTRNHDPAVIPVMNVAEEEFRVRTEVVYYLRRHNVPLNLLTFRSQVALEVLAGERRLELVLVDHHALPERDSSLADSVVEIIDHRPRDAAWPWRGRTINLQTVGSCATLVAGNVLARRPEALDSQVSNLLRGAILIDTCNFSKEANRATPLDLEVMQRLEEVDGVRDDRETVYKEILAAKTDISELTPRDLLIKDYKMAGGVPIAGLPVLVEEFIKLEGAYEAVESFTRARNGQLAILMGLDLKNDVVTRDIAVFSLSPDELENKVIRALTSATQPSLQLTESSSLVEPGRRFLLYRQGNVRASRKQILPIVQSAAVAAPCQC
ncbi:exopolyphosphatase PRUNE1 [Orussus abietinus]|uniref:exopolyphosphatase PRUNE1 n=1 Tax=Orussus abietinus TaxID=222816 RepID=UPI000624F796|nr:exopolyphosphatase PRUNE1 [Orussus abietinus]